MGKGRGVTVGGGGRLAVVVVKKSIDLSKDGGAK